MPAPARRNKDENVDRLRGALALAGDGFEQVTARIHEFHRAISDIPFKALEPAPGVNAGAGAVRRVHDPITDGVYSTVRLTGRAVFQLAGVVLKSAQTLARSEAPVAERANSPRRDLAIGALNGLVGDHLSSTRNGLSVRPGFFLDGQRLDLTRASLAQRYPQATSRIAVFVHGLCCSEHVWEMYRRPDDPESRPYCERLTDELGFTPVYLRYNSGLHVSQNGRALARLLRRLTAEWPVGIEEIVLIGHSMGGLVSRAAAASGLVHSDAWTQRVSNVICLGSPHRGAPLERLAHLGAGLLEQFSLGRPWARVLDSRSMGIRDLRFGYVADADWRGRDCKTQYDAFLAPVAHIPGARYHFIGTTLGRDEHDPIGKLLGDGLVQLPSATARELADADTAVLFREHHIRLLNHPAVYALIKERLRATL